MNILAIETSCDETAAAVVTDAATVRSNVVWSQIAVHQPFGGVVPELAARAHIEAIIPVTKTALELANLGWDGIDAIAVTNRPDSQARCWSGSISPKHCRWLAPSH